MCDNIRECSSNCTPEAKQLENEPKILWTLLVPKLKFLWEENFGIEACIRSKRQPSLYCQHRCCFMVPKRVERWRARPCNQKQHPKTHGLGKTQWTSGDLARGAGVPWMCTLTTNITTGLVFSQKLGQLQNFDVKQFRVGLGVITFCYARIWSMWGLQSLLLPQAALAYALQMCRMHHEYGIPYFRL